MLAEDLLAIGRRVDAPDGLHLLAAGHLAHDLIVEAVLTLFVLGRPDDGLGRVREVAAGEIRRRVGLLPGDVVEDFEAKLLHRVTDGEDDVVRARHPDAAVGLEHLLAAAQPFRVELMVQLRAAGFVPRAFVHLDHAAGVAGDAAVRKEVRRVGENHVEAAVGVLGGDGVEDFEAVALIEPDAAGVVAVDAVERDERTGVLDDAVERIDDLRRFGVGGLGFSFSGHVGIDHRRGGKIKIIFPETTEHTEHKEGRREAVGSGRGSWQQREAVPQVGMFPGNLSFRSGLPIA